MTSEIFQSVFNFIQNNKIEYIHANDYCILVKFDGNLNENYWQIDIEWSFGKSELNPRKISKEKFQEEVENRF